MDDYIFHIRPGASEPEVCGDPATCSLSPHARGIKEAEKLMAKRTTARAALLPSFTKKDLPLLRESERTGRSIIELRKEGW